MNLHLKKIALLAFALTGFTTAPAKADWDYWAVDYAGDGIGNRIWTVDSLTGNATLRSTRIFETNGWRPQDSYVDAKTGGLVIYNGANRLEKYNLETNQWDVGGTPWTGFYQKVFERPTVVGNTDGTASIGIGNSSIQIEKNGNGISSGTGDSLIRIDAATGALHIGKNSLVTIEEGGVQKLYATDANGNAIPINITNGTDLQINGTSVYTQINTLDNNVNIHSDQINTLNTTVNTHANQINTLNTTVNTHANQINTLNTTVNTHANQINTLNNRVGNLESNVNNLGSGVAGATALTAGLTALPATSDDSPVSCGVGSGGYSSRYAMGFGCAARVTERLAFNAGGSYLFGGASNYGGGTLDNVAGRLGFVFKIGKITPTSTQVISKKAEQLESQLSEVKQENQKLTAYLEDMKKLIAMQNERLGNLEKVANISGSQLASQSQKPSPNFEVANSSR